MNSTFGAAAFVKKMNETIETTQINLEFATLSDADPCSAYLKTPEHQSKMCKHGQHSNHQLSFTPGSKTVKKPPKSGRIPTLMELASTQLKPKPAVQYRGGKPIVLSDRARMHGWWH